MIQRIYITVTQQDIEDNKKNVFGFSISEVARKKVLVEGGYIIKYSKRLVREINRYQKEGRFEPGKYMITVSD